MASVKQAKPLTPDHPLFDLETAFAGLCSAQGLLLAVSGGPDSMALMCLANQWRQTRLAAGKTAPDLAVATIDHLLRPESAEEARLVAQQAAARNMPHVILRWTDEKPQNGLLEAARKARYRLLADHARALRFGMIVTAHHADDQAETVLMRLLRGSGPRGLAGMAAMARTPGAHDIGLARPLLAWPKAALIDQCVAAGIPFRHDPTNENLRYRRPQLRALAALLAAEGLTRENLNKLAMRCARAEATVDLHVDASLKALAAQRSAVCFSADAAAIAKLSDEMLVRLMSQEIARINPQAKPRLEQIEPLAHMLSEKHFFTKTLGGVTIRLDQTGLRMSLAPPRKTMGERRKKQ